MALDFLKLADPKLERTYRARPKKDPTPGRRGKVIAGIDNALKQLKSGEQNPKRGWYSTREGISQCSIRLGARPLAVQGQTSFYVPHERAADFYTNARKSVEAGELDSSINALFGATGAKGTRKTRGPMNPEKVYQRNVRRYGKARADELKARQSK